MAPMQTFGHRSRASENPFQRLREAAARAEADRIRSQQLVQQKLSILAKTKHRIAQYEVVIRKRNGHLARLENLRGQFDQSLHFVAAKETPLSHEVHSLEGQIHAFTELSTKVNTGAESGASMGQVLAKMSERLTAGVDDHIAVKQEELHKAKLALKDGQGVNEEICRTIETITTQHAAREQKMVAKSNEKAMLMEELHDVRKQQQNQRQILNEMTTAVTTSTEELDQQRNMGHETVKEIDIIEKDLQRREHEHAEMLKEAEHNLAQIRQERHKLSTRLLAKETSNAELQASLERVENEKRILCESNETIAATLERTENSICTKRSTLEEAQQRLSAVVADLDNAKKKCSSVAQDKRQVAAVRETMQHTETELSSVRGCLEELRVSIEELTAQKTKAAGFRSAQTEMMSRISDMESRVNSRAEHTAHLQSTLSDLRSQRKSLLDKYDRLKGELSDLKKLPNKLPEPKQLRRDQSLSSPVDGDQHVDVVSAKNAKSPATGESILLAGNQHPTSVAKPTASSKRRKKNSNARNPRRALPSTTTTMTTTTMTTTTTTIQNTPKRATNRTTEHRAPSVEKRHPKSPFVTSRWKSRGSLAREPRKPLRSRAGATADAYDFTGSD